MSQWILAIVLDYNATQKSYKLDCKARAPRDRVRPHQREKLSSPDVNDKTRQHIHRRGAQRSARVRARMRRPRGRPERAERTTELAAALSKSETKIEKLEAKIDRLT